MDQDKLIQRFETDFEQMKQDLKLESTLDELDSVFFLNDFVLKNGFVSPKLSRMVCSRIAETFSSWSGYLHSIICPAPQNLINVTESQMFDEKEKNQIIGIINNFMAYISTNTLAGLSKDKDMEKRFIDGSLKLWNEIINERLIDILNKVNNGWIEKTKPDSKKEMKS